MTRNEIIIRIREFAKEKINFFPLNYNLLFIYVSKQKINLMGKITQKFNKIKTNKIAFFSKILLFDLKQQQDNNNNNGSKKKQFQIVLFIVKK